MANHISCDEMIKFTDQELNTAECQVPDKESITYTINRMEITKLQEDFGYVLLLYDKWDIDKTVGNGTLQRILEMKIKKEEHQNKPTIFSTNNYRQSERLKEKSVKKKWMEADKIEFPTKLLPAIKHKSTKSSQKPFKPEKPTIIKPEKEIAFIPNEYWILPKGSAFVLTTFTRIDKWIYEIKSSVKEDDQNLGELFGQYAINLSTPNMNDPINPIRKVEHFFDKLEDLLEINNVPYLVLNHNVKLDYEDLLPLQMEYINTELQEYSDKFKGSKTTFNTGYNISALRAQDLNSNQVDTNFCGDPTVWFIIKRHYGDYVRSECAKAIARAKFDETDNEIVKKCILQHKRFFFHSNFFRKINVPFQVVVQNPGNAILTGYGSICQNVSLGFSITKSANVVNNHYRMNFEAFMDQCHCTGYETRNVKPQSMPMFGKRIGWHVEFSIDHVKTDSKITFKKMTLPNIQLSNKKINEEADNEIEKRAVLHTLGLVRCGQQACQTDGKVKSGVDDEMFQATETCIFPGTSKDTIEVQFHEEADNGKMMTGQYGTEVEKLSSGLATGQAHANKVTTEKMKQKSTVVTLDNSGMNAVGSNIVIERPSTMFPLASYNAEPKGRRIKFIGENPKWKEIRKACQQSKVCSVCNLKLTRIETLNHHMYLHFHKRERKCKCPEKDCNYIAYTMKNLKTHSRKHSLEKLECPICNNKYTQPNKLKEHQRRTGCDKQMEREKIKQGK